MKNLFLSISLFLFGQVNAQCVKLYINEHLTGSPICKFSKGDFIEICEDLNEVNGCPRDFYIYDKGFSSGSLTYELSLDKGWSTHYMTLMVNPNTKRFGFVLQGQTAMYSYYTEEEMAGIRVSQSEKEKIEYQKQIEFNKKEDENLKFQISEALDKKEFFKARQLCLKLNSFDKELDTRTNLNWLPLKKELDKYYKEYTDSILHIKSVIYTEYFRNKSTYLDQNKSRLTYSEVRWSGMQEIEKRISMAENEEIKKARIFMKDHRLFYYEKIEEKNIVCPLSLSMNYFFNDKLNKVTDIKILCRIDTVSNSHVGEINLTFSDQQLIRGYIFNPYTFSLPTLNFPYSQKLNSIIEKINEEGGVEFINSNYPEQKIQFDYELNIKTELQEVNPPESGKRNENYERAENLFKKISVKKYLDTKEYSYFGVNPAVTMLLSSFYPKAHYFGFSKKNSMTDPLMVTKNGNSQFILFIYPIEKENKNFDLKTNVLKVFDEKGNYEEIKLFHVSDTVNYIADSIYFNRDDKSRINLIYDEELKIFDGREKYIYDSNVLIPIFKIQSIRKQDYNELRIPPGFWGATYERSRSEMYYKESVLLQEFLILFKNALLEKDNTKKEQLNINLQKLLSKIAKDKN